MPETLLTSLARDRRGLVLRRARRIPTSRYRPAGDGVTLFDPSTYADAAALRAAFPATAAAGLGATVSDPGGAAIYGATTTNAGTAVSHIDLVPDGAGGKAMAVTYPAAGGTNQAPFSANHAIRTGPLTTDFAGTPSVWVARRVRFPGGRAILDGASGGAQSHAYKLFRGIAAGGWGGALLTVEVTGGAGASSYVLGGGITWANGYAQQSYATSDRFDGQSPLPFVSVSNLLDTGWHDVIACCSRVGPATNRYRLWHDWVPVYEYTHTYQAVDGAGNPWPSSVNGGVPRTPDFAWITGPLNENRPPDTDTTAEYGPLNIIDGLRVADPFGLGA